MAANGNTNKKQDTMFLHNHGPWKNMQHYMKQILNQILGEMSTLNVIKHSLS